MAEAEPADVFVLPASSRIRFEVDAGPRGRIDLPRRGFRLADVVQVLFALFAIAFALLWTLLAAYAGAFFLILAIPCWLIVTGMLWGLLLGWSETQVIGFDDRILTVSKRSLVSSSVREIPLGEITTIESTTVALASPIAKARYFRYVRLTQRWSGGLVRVEPIGVAAIQHGRRRTLFAEHATPEEKKWLVRLLGVCALPASERGVS